MCSCYWSGDGMILCYGCEQRKIRGTVESTNYDLIQQIRYLIEKVNHLEDLIKKNC
jgi:hypothetical protein